MSTGEVIVVYHNIEQWVKKYRNKERPISTDLLNAMYGATDSRLETVWDEAIGEEGEYVPSRREDAEAVYEGYDGEYMERLKAYWSGVLESDKN